ncbi:MAG: glycerate kinase, partial [Bacteroidota bacterium]
FELIAEITDLERQIQKSDWVICGEGKLDGQSLQGKVVGEIARLCRLHQKPLTLLVGKNELRAQHYQELGVKKVYSITAQAQNSADAMNRAAYYLEQLATDCAKKIH